jgi:hypothetical protein
VIRDLPPSWDQGNNSLFELIFCVPPMKAFSWNSKDNHEMLELYRVLTTTHKPDVLLRSWAKDGIDPTGG